MSVLNDVTDLINTHRTNVELFGITADAAREVSALILALGDQIAADNGLTNQEAAGKLLPGTELSEEAEIIFDQLQRLILPK